MKQRTNIFFVAAIALCLGGCGLTLPRYEGDPANNQALKAAEAKPLQLGAFAPANKKLGRISIRANPVRSPYSGDMAGYLREALRMELDKASMLATESHTELSGTITALDIDAASGSGTGALAVHFMVTSQGQTVYDKTLAVNKAWESSFIGAVAIPRAAAAYPAMVKDLIGKLVTDPDFVSAIR